MFLVATGASSAIPALAADDGGRAAANLAPPTRGFFIELGNPIDLRTLDCHRDAAVTSLIPSLSCRSSRPNAPFAELVRMSRTSIADEMREEHRRRELGE